MTLTLSTTAYNSNDAGATPVGVTLRCEHPACAGNFATDAGWPGIGFLVVPVDESGRAAGVLTPSSPGALIHLRWPGQFTAGHSTPPTNTVLQIYIFSYSTSKRICSGHEIPIHI